jgi:hypothetical protein
MAATFGTTKPAIGMVLAIKASAAEPLAGIPGRVIHIWPRFRSGDYLVTLEYEQPIKTQQGLIAHIDAFMSELDRPMDAHAAGTVGSGLWRALGHSAA